MGDENHENIDQNSKREVKIEAISENKIQIDQIEFSKKKRKKKECQKWGNMQKLRYLLFLIKYKQVTKFKNQQKEIDYFEKMCACVEYLNYKYCRAIHQQLLKKYKNVQGIFDHTIQQLYFDKEIIMIENNRIDEILKNYDQNLIKRISKPAQHEIQNNINSINFGEKIEAYQVKQQVIQVLKFIGQFQNIEKQELQQSGNLQYRFYFPIQILIVIEKQSPIGTQFKQVQQKQQNKTIQNLKIEDEQKIRMKKNKKNLLKLRKSKHKKMKKMRDQQKLNSIDNENQNAIQKVYKFKRIKKQADNSRRVYWTRPENMKLVIFLVINKAHFDQHRLRNVNSIYQKCSQYINTDKTPKKCQYRISTLLKQYGMNFAKAIKGQVERLKISQELIKKQRRNYNLICNKKLKCEIKIQDLFIQRSIMAEEQNVSTTINQIVQLNYQIQFYYTNKLQNQVLTSTGNLIKWQDIELPQDKQQLSKKIKKIKIQPLKPVKDIVRIRVSDRIFFQLMKDFQGQLFIKNSNRCIEIKMQKQLVIHMQFN